MADCPACRFDAVAWYRSTRAPVNSTDPVAATTGPAPLLYRGGGTARSRPAGPTPRAGGLGRHHRRLDPSRARRHADASPEGGLPALPSYTKRAGRPSSLAWIPSLLSGSANKSWKQRRSNSNPCCSGWLNPSTTTCLLLEARRLLAYTAMPVGEIAHPTGLRGFNSCPPTNL